MEADADVGDVLGGDDGEMDDGGDFGDSFDDDFDDDFDDSMDDMGGDDMDEDSEDGGGGTSFADLKDEYESGDADWADEDEDAAEESDEGMAMDGEMDDAFDEELDESEDDSADEFGDDLGDDELFDEVIDEDDEESDEEMAVAEETTEPEPEPATAEPEPEPESEPEPEPTTADSEPASETDTDQSSDEGKPYLSTLPEGYASDLIVVEWLEFLVEEAGVRETAQAIDYYETIDWINEAVADDLQEYLRGFDGGGTGTLTIDHHTQSLKYISQLNGESAAFGMMGGGADGLKR
jgi:flagellar protein FlaE